MKAANEVTTRKRMMDWAKHLGCEVELTIMLNYYDEKLKKCTNEQEKKAIAREGIVSVHTLLSCRGGLSINNENVLPPLS